MDPSLPAQPPSLSLGALLILVWGVGGTTEGLSARAGSALRQYEKVLEAAQPGGYGKKKQQRQPSIAPSVEAMAKVNLGSAAAAAAAASQPAPAMIVNLDDRQSSPSPPERGDDGHLPAEESSIHRARGPDPRPAAAPAAAEGANGAIAAQRGAEGEQTPCVP
jgi:hypothetical protein